MFLSNYIPTTTLETADGGTSDDECEKGENEPNIRHKHKVRDRGGSWSPLPKGFNTHQTLLRVTREETHTIMVAAPSCRDRRRQLVRKRDGQRDSVP